MKLKEWQRLIDNGINPVVMGKAQDLCHKIHMRPVANDDEGNYCLVADQEQIEDIIYQFLLRYKDETKS